MYKKRAGTSGIRGQLYETKLISLLLFRAKHDESLEEFYLATNIDGIGDFDDICFRARIKGFDRTVIVFIQAKHKDNAGYEMINDTNDFTKYFDSYLRIRRAFKPNNADIFFNGAFEDVQCVFVLYTNAKGDVNNTLADNELVGKLNSLISTDAAAGYFPYYTNKTYNHLCKLALEDEITLLASRIAECVYEEAGYQMMLDEDLILRYHVIMAREIVELSDIQPEGHRVASFRDSLFNTKDELIELFRKRLFIEVVKKYKVNAKIDLTRKNLRDAQVLSELIGSMVKYNENEKLEFIDESTSDDLKKKLSRVPKATVDEAVQRAAKNILATRSFKVPPAFGNKDLTVTGSDEEVDSILNNLTSITYDLLSKPHPGNIVTIDESVAKEFLQLNGGMAGAVGNILVLDTRTDLLMFTDNCAGVGQLAKQLHTKLISKIPNLFQYKFDVNVTKFPKLSFVCGKYEKDLAQDFLKKLLYYTNQADESRVEDILIEEIEDLQCNNYNNFHIKSHAIFVTYHDKIQKLWKIPKDGTYLTKKSQVFEETMNSIVKESLMSAMNAIYRNKVKYMNYTFQEHVLDSLKLQDQLPSTILVTDSSALTLTKVVQYLKTKDHVVLDLEHIISLQKPDCIALCDEIQNTNKNKKIIFVCENIPQSKNPAKALAIIGKAVCEKTKILIANKTTVATIKKYFSDVVNLDYDVITNLSDLSEESRSDILKNAKVIFQGEEVALETIVDEEAMAFVEGDVLTKLIGQETVTLGKSLSNSMYDKLHFYVERHFTRGNNNPADSKTYENIETLYDITDDVVLVTAIPGMGKSTLLTHLSLKTKKENPGDWIVRINLEDHQEQFSIWQDKKTTIDTLETLKFVCQVILGEKIINLEDHQKQFSKWQDKKTTIDTLETLKLACQVIIGEESGKDNALSMTLEENNGEVNIKIEEYKDRRYQAIVFHLKMFLHFYNKRKVIFLFDGFDEIYPHYETAVIDLLKAVKGFARKHKMWIASRSYNQIKSILQREFGIAYELQYFSDKDIETYLYYYWKKNLLLHEFTIEQLNNVQNFIEYMWNIICCRTVNKLQNLLLHKIYFNVFEYMKNELRYSYIPLWKDKKRCSSCTPSMNPIVYKAFDYFYHRARIGMRYNGGSSDTSNMLQFFGTPLHLYLLADYVQNEIKGVSKDPKEWNVDINTYTIIEHFLKAKLKIRFQEKDNVDIYRSGIISRNEKETAEFIDKHKRLAAYAIFHGKAHLLFSEQELVNIQNDLKDNMIAGKEKTGLIYSVSNEGIPVFVHKTFAEFFAVEYISDLLKNKKCKEKQELSMEIMMNEMFYNSPANVRNIFDTKLKIDDALKNVLENNGRFIFNLLSEQTKRVENFETSLHRAVVDNLENFISLFLSILEKYLYDDNIDDFINIIRESHVFGLIDTDKYKVFIYFALDIVRELKPSSFNLLFNKRNFSPNVDYLSIKNTILIDTIQSIVSLSAPDTIPYYYYNEEQDKYDFELN